MEILITCIILTTLLGVVFKYFPIFKVNALQAIVVNYYACVLTASVVMGSFAIPSDVFQKSWFPHALLLSTFFIVGFNVLAKSIKEGGVVVTTIFQKISLIGPAVLGLFFYSESAGYLKIVGLILAILSLIFIQYQGKNQKLGSVRVWIFWAVLTFFVSVVIESYIYLLEVESIAPNGDIQFVATLFLLAGSLGLIGVIYEWIFRAKKPELKSLVAGIALGVPNFFTIYLLLVLLDHGWEGSLLFPVNSIGVLVLSAIVGIVLFKEKMNIQRYIGFILAILAIMLIVL